MAAYDQVGRGQSDSCCVRCRCDAAGVILSHHVHGGVEGHGMALAEYERAERHELLSRMDLARLLSFPSGSTGKRKFGQVLRIPNAFMASWLALARGVRRDRHGRYT